jgi:hypothetical protein
MTKVNLTKKFIDNLETIGTVQVFYDAKITSLHLKISPGEKKAFYLYFRTKAGEQKRPKLGNFGIMTVEQVRNLARVMLGELSKGDDPTLQAFSGTYYPQQQLSASPCSVMSGSFGN